MVTQGSRAAEAPSVRPALAVMGILAILLPLTIVAGYALPSPAALMTPAALEPVDSLVKVDGSAAAANGHLYLVNLRLASRPSLGQYLLARLQADVEAVPRSLVLPPEVDAAEFEQLSQRLASESQRIAEVVALRESGARVWVDEGEVEVLSTIAGTPASLELQPGDVIEVADGETISAAAELVSIVREHMAGEALDLNVRREGLTQTVTLPAQSGPLDTQGPVLGTLLITNGFDYQAPVTVSTSGGGLSGGPSSALMYALGVYDAVATEDIVRGHRIAGTGTLRLNGSVGPVDGIALKVRAAEQGGAEYFLAPAADAAAAQAAARDMKIVAVRTFQEALATLRKLGSENEHGIQVVPPGGDTTLASLSH